MLTKAVKLTLNRGRKTITCKALIMDHRKSSEIENRRFSAKLEAEKAATDFPIGTFVRLIKSETKG